jgi:signal transduction histidine kinase/ActR/RegA family two-component response regulator
VDLYYDFAPCGYLTLTPSGSISRINLTGLAMLGCEKKRVYEKPFWRFVDTVSEYDYFETLASLSRMKTRHRLEMKLVPDTDPSFWVQADIRPDLYENGEIRQLRMTVVDISDRVAAEKKLVVLNAALEERVKARTEELEKYSERLRRLTLTISEAENHERKRIAGLLHDDLQQLLAGIRFHLQIAQRDGADEKLREEKLDYISKLVDESIHKTRVLSQELNPPVLSQSGLSAALRWLAGNMRERHGFEVTVESDDSNGHDSHPAVSMLFHSAKELLFNSFKHSGGDRAKIELKRENDFLKIVVSDRGKGCDIRKIEKKKENGTAFGLFKIAERVELSGGTFELETAPGEGCRATMQIPVESKKKDKKKEGLGMGPQQVSTSNESKVPQAAAGGRKVRILLADDHTAIREAMADLFRSKDVFEVVAQAENGREAVELAKKNGPDIVLMDVSMPEMDGVEATALIRKTAPNVRVVGLSMHENEITKKKMMSAGASAYIGKSTPLSKLVEIIRDIQENSP